MNNANHTFAQAAELMDDLGFCIVAQDKNRPWGGFYVIDEAQAQDFANHFFPEEDFEKLKLSKKLSPKILMVAPGKRLSWQYHHRRAEIWRCIDGQVGVVTSLTNEEAQKHTLKVGDKIKLQQGERHRLVGLDDWGVVAEIWQHTDANKPSDEEDIVRLQDDFGR
ncbi:MAG: phosphoheptose isomerase [Bacteroidetes bacterium]|nr:MAG: phosphoheptose isomerase [Bacteroidota bacterium]PTM08322.1 MAG: phosphoheptose isomerase [Bacteroidota bacterium]